MKYHIRGWVVMTNLMRWCSLLLDGMYICEYENEGAESKMENPALTLSRLSSLRTENHSLGLGEGFGTK